MQKVAFLLVLQNVSTEKLQTSLVMPAWQYMAILYLKHVCVDNRGHADSIALVGEQRKTKTGTQEPGNTAVYIHPVRNFPNLNYWQTETTVFSNKQTQTRQKAQVTRKDPAGKIVGADLHRLFQPKAACALRTSWHEASRRHRINLLRPQM